MADVHVTDHALERFVERWPMADATAQDVLAALATTTPAPAWLAPFFSSRKHRKDPGDISIAPNGCRFVQRGRHLVSVLPTTPAHTTLARRHGLIPHAPTAQAEEGQMSTTTREPVRKVVRAPKPEHPGVALRARRLAAGLTQGKVAHWARLSQSTVCQVELGRIDDDRYVRRIGAALDRTEARKVEAPETTALPKKIKTWDDARRVRLAVGWSRGQVAAACGITASGVAFQERRGKAPARSDGKATLRRAARALREAQAIANQPAPTPPEPTTAPRGSVSSLVYGAAQLRGALGDESDEVPQWDDLIKDVHDLAADRTAQRGRADRAEGLLADARQFIAERLAEIETLSAQLDKAKVWAADATKRADNITGLYDAQAERVKQLAEENERLRDELDGYDQPDTGFELGPALADATRHALIVHTLQACASDASPEWIAECMELARPLVALAAK